MARGKVGIILQARMGSTRLPGKVLKPLAGRPMIEWIWERLARIGRADERVVATTGSPGDAVLIDFLESKGIPYSVGSELDVLDRYYQCAKDRGYSHVVRATADNPFVDPEAGEALIGMHLDRDLDYANAFPEQGSGFPRGVGLEIFRFEALEESWKRGSEPHHREHVNEYILERLPEFKHGVWQADPRVRAPELSLTVDHPEEFERAEFLYREYSLENRGLPPPLAWVVRKLSR